jgi:hypothetical protein
MTNDILKNLIKTIENILGIQELPNVGKIPKTLVPLSNIRNGMSAIRATEKVLVMKRNLGLPTGNLVDGTANDDDILWYTAIKAIIHEITSESKITSTSVPGQQTVASGGNAGGPVVVYGQTITFSDGGSVIS